MTPRLRHAAGLHLLFSLACTAPPAGAEPAGAAPIATPIVAAPAAPAPPSVPAPAVAASQLQPGCRALVNLEAQGYRVVDLELGAPDRAAVGEGLVARLDDGRSFVLNKVTDEKVVRNRYGSATATWDLLMMASIPGGKYEVLLGEAPELVLPDSELRGDFDDTRGLSIVGMFGPYLSVSGSSGGYSGGAHGFDDASYSTLKLPDGAAVGLDLLGQGALAAAVTAVTRTNGERLAQDLESIDLPKDLRGFGLALTRGGATDPPPPVEAALELRSVISCCTWAENHNLFFLEVPLDRPPPALEPYFKVGATPRARFEAPDGCGAVGFAEGKLWARLGSEGAPRPVELPGVVVGALLGVTWIPATDPFAVASIPALPKVIKDVARLGAEEQATIAAAYLGAGATLAHPMFRGNVGPAPDTILVFSRSDANGPAELSGFALVPAGDGHRKVELPNFGAGKYNDSVGAILFDNLDADPEREVIVMGVYIHGIGPESGKPYHLNTALDWDGGAFGEMTALAPKIGALASAAEVRAALRAKE